MIHAFLYGFLLALGLIIPLGMQNIFIFNQGAMHADWRGALPSVVTAAFCDTLLILIAVLGISVTALTIPLLKNTLIGVGFLFLIYMSYVTFRASPMTHQSTSVFSTRRQIHFAASVSLFNPHALLDTTAIIGTSSLHFYHAEKWLFSAACITVSWIWFFGLSYLGHTLHKLDLSGGWIKRINRLSAVIMLSIAVYLAWSFMSN